MDRLMAIYTITSAEPRDDHALFDSSTRSAYERGFDAMRAIALAAVRPKENSVLNFEDFRWTDEP